MHRIATWIPHLLLVGLVLTGGTLLDRSDRRLEIRLDQAEARAATGRGADEHLADEIARLARSLDSLSPSPAPAPLAIPVHGTVPGDDLEARLIAMAAKAGPSVVSIECGRQVGSGVVIDAEGVLLTSDHVVASGAPVTVILASGRRHQATRLGRERSSDLACLRIDAVDLTPIEFGDSDRLQVGQVVAAIGNPFGLGADGVPTVTLGIVSALHRRIPLAGGRLYDDAIQTDAAINPGNSGGAIVDLDGRLVGLVGAITSETGTSAGVGFAVPAGHIAGLLERLRQDRPVDGPRLGLFVGDLVHGGAVVTGVVAGGPADRAGLRAGDAILRIDDQPLDSAADLRARLDRVRGGQSIALAILRDGSYYTTRLRLGR